ALRPGPISVPQLPVQRPNAFHIRRDRASVGRNRFALPLYPVHYRVAQHLQRVRDPVLRNAHRRITRVSRPSPWSRFEQTRSLSGRAREYAAPGNGFRGYMISAKPTTERLNLRDPRELLWNGLDGIVTDESNRVASVGAADVHYDDQGHAKAALV